MIDMSIGLGTGKILTVLALNAHHHQLSPAAPGLQDVHCMAVSVADSWTGDCIAAFLERLIASAGRPAAYLKDGGTDLQKAIRLLDEQGLGSPCIDDISHVIANLLKWWYQDHPLFETFLSACGRVSGKLKQTVLACLAPPKVQTKALYECAPPYQMGRTTAQTLSRRRCTEGLHPLKAASVSGPAALMQGFHQAIPRRCRATARVPEDPQGSRAKSLHDSPVRAIYPSHRLEPCSR